MNKNPSTIVIGAGIGGLTTAALLLKAGHDVTVLEAHIYPGGSAGTFYHKKFRFDAGATLAGGFATGGPHAQLAEILELEWPIHPVDPAWVVHLPDGRAVTQWANADQWEAEYQMHFPETGAFWHKQKMLANASWDISTRPFPWPPQNIRDFTTLAKALRPQTLKAVPYLFNKIDDLHNSNDPLFRAFLDGQLLISAQTTSKYASALYGSTALDLPRRGVNHVQGGMGALADTLVKWIQQNGGRVLFRQMVTEIEMKNGRATAVITKKGTRFAADQIIANVTPWGLNNILGENAPTSLQKRIQNLQPTWGAFTLYLGLDSHKLPSSIPDHQQIIVDHTKPLGEGNSVFVSLSDRNDLDRAPQGMRTATLSTHTAVSPWWQLRNSNDKATYLEKREQYMERLLTAADHAIPGIRNAITLCLPGTPVTFEFYTKRPFGMVGGFAQTSIFAANGSKTGIPNVWLVGDSIFPGQSTAGVTLGGMRVANDVLRETAVNKKSWPKQAWNIKPIQKNV